MPSIDNPENAAFQEKFRAKHGRDGSEFGVAAYDTARLVVEGLQATSGHTDDKQALVTAMHRVQFDGPRGPFRIDPETNNVIQNIYISEVEKVGDSVGAVVKTVLPNVREAEHLFLGIEPEADFPVLLDREILDASLVNCHPLVNWMTTALAPADLVICNARDWTELFSRPQADRIVLREGKQIDTTLPDYAVLDHLMEARL